METNLFSNLGRSRFRQKFAIPKIPFTVEFVNYGQGVHIFHGGKIVMRMESNSFAVSAVLRPMAYAVGAKAYGA